jgi:hypothetical protein
MEDTTITRDELKARWAFNEFRTERGKVNYAQLCPEKIRDGVRFSELAPQEVSHLVWMAEQYRAPLMPDLKADRYECKLWTKEQLGRTYTIRRMAPSRNDNIPFLSFVACPRFTELANPQLLEQSDPRVQADKIPFDEPLRQEEPVIVLPCDTAQILIEGYLRGVLFMRSRDPDSRIMVWVPALP